VTLRADKANAERRKMPLRCLEARSVSEPGDAPPSRGNTYSSVKLSGSYRPETVTHVLADGPRSGEISVENRCFFPTP